MRPITLNLTGIKDPQVVAALLEIQRASYDTLQQDSSSPGAAMGTAPFPTDGSFAPNTFPYFSRTTPTIAMKFSPLSAVPLNTLTASNVAALQDTTSFTGFDNYMIVFENVVPVTGVALFRVRVHSGGTFQTTGYLNVSGTTVAYDMTFAQTIDNTASRGISGVLFTGNLSSTTNIKMMTSNAVFFSSGAINGSAGQGVWNGNPAVDGFQFTFSTGNISTGVIKIYGFP